jgi:hypothetical protein
VHADRFASSPVGHQGTHPGGSSCSSKRRSARLRSSPPIFRCGSGRGPAPLRGSRQLDDRGADDAGAGVDGVTVAEVEPIAFGVDDAVDDRFGARLGESVVEPPAEAAGGGAPAAPGGGPQRRTVLGADAPRHRAGVGSRAASRMSSSAVSSSSSAALRRPPAASSSRQPARRRAGSGSASRASSASRSCWNRSPAAAASSRARAGVIHGPHGVPSRELLIASFIRCPLGSGGRHGVPDRPVCCIAGAAAWSRSPRDAVHMPRQ